MDLYFLEMNIGKEIVGVVVSFFGFGLVMVGYKLLPNPQRPIVVGHRLMDRNVLYLLQRNLFTELWVRLHLLVLTGCRI